MKKKRNNSVILQWKKGVVVEGKVKKFFLNKYNRLMCVMATDKGDVIFNIPVVLRNLLKSNRDKLIGSTVKVVCSDYIEKGNYGYYFFELYINGVRVETEKGLSLL